MASIRRARSHGGYFLSPIVFKAVGYPQLDTLLLISDGVGQPGQNGFFFLRLCRLRNLINSAVPFRIFQVVANRFSPHHFNLLDEGQLLRDLGICYLRSSSRKRCRTAVFARWEGRESL